MGSSLHIAPGIVQVAGVVRVRLPREREIFADEHVCKKDVITR